VEVVFLDRDGRYDQSAPRLESAIRPNDDYSPLNAMAVLPDGSVALAGRLLRRASSASAFGVAIMAAVDSVELAPDCSELLGQVLSA
jgi:hypothetical protein